MKVVVYCSTLEFKVRSIRPGFSNNLQLPGIGIHPVYEPRVSRWPQAGLNGADPWQAQHLNIHSSVMALKLLSEYLGVGRLCSHMYGQSIYNGLCSRRYSGFLGEIFLADSDVDYCSMMRNHLMNVVLVLRCSIMSKACSLNRREA